MNKPEWLFKEEQAPNKIKFKKLYTSKRLKQIARQNLKKNEELDKELAKQKIDPYYFTGRDIQLGFNINFDSDNIDYATSISTLTPNFSEFGIEFRYINNKILKEMAAIYGRLINQYKFKYHILLSSSFYKIN